MRLFKKKQNILPRRRMAITDISIKSSDTFQRNRTLSGTTSDRLNSVNVLKSGLQSPRTHVHRLATIRRRVFSTLLIIFISMVVIWLIISNFTATPLIVISDSHISKPVKSARYSAVIQDYLEINPMGRFSFFLDQLALSEYVASKLPEVSSVTLQGMQEIGKTNFKIAMRKPVAGWIIDGKQYYVDSKGVSYLLNYYSDPTVLIVDNSGVPVQTGVNSVSKRFLGFVGRVVSQTANYGYTVTKAILPPGTTRELDINVKDVVPYIKLSIDRSVGEQAEDMDRAVRYFKTNGITPAYIDVRVSNKAFYK